MTPSLVLALVLVGGQAQQVPEQPAIVQKLILRGAIIPPPVAPAGAPLLDLDDEAILDSVELPTDPVSLATFLRKQKIDESDLPRVGELVQQLGDDNFDLRQGATEELIRLGPTAVPALKEALKSKDLEVLRRAEACLKAIDSVSGPVYQEAVVRLLAKKAPETAVDVLLEVVPDLRGDGVIDAVAESLSRAGVPGGRPVPALIQALADKTAVRREVAGGAVALAGDADARKTVAALLNDPDVAVRFRVATHLLDRGEPAALPVLVKLLPEAPLDQAYDVESQLLGMARDTAPELGLGKTAQSRKRAAEAWQAWYEKTGRTLDLDKILEERSKPGPILVSLQNIGAGAAKGKIVEMDAAGKTNWEFELPVGYSFSVQRLPRDRVLVAEYTGRKITERTTKGEVVWTREVAGQLPVGAIRLPGGNTLINLRTQILEVDAEGKDVRTLIRNAGDQLYSIEALRNGEIAAITSTGRYVRLDAQGKEQASFQLGGNIYTIGAHFAVSPNGTRVTVPLYRSTVVGAGGVLVNAGKVVEYDSTGKVIWEAEADRPTSVRRMANGNLLVGSRFHGTILELDSRGKLLKRHQSPGNQRVYDVH